MLFDPIDRRWLFSAADSGRWVTIDGHHVFIGGSAGYVPTRLRAEDGAAKRFTRAGLQRALIEHHRAMGGEEHPYTQQMDDELTSAGGSSAFHNHLPAEIKDRLDGNPHLLKVFRTTDNAGSAKGEDTYQNMDFDRYMQIAEAKAGSPVAAALKTARSSPDPEARLLAHIHDNLPEDPAAMRGKATRLRKAGGAANLRRAAALETAANETKGTDVIKAGGLRVGDQFEMHGQKFRVAEDENGFRVLRSHEYGQDVPVDAVSHLPIDRGAFKPGRTTAKNRDAGREPIPFSRFDPLTSAYLHEQNVKLAQQMGLPVPPKVAADYPSHLSRFSWSRGRLSLAAQFAGPGHWITEGGRHIYIAGPGLFEKGLYDLDPAEGQPSEHFKKMVGAFRGTNYTAEHIADEIERARGTPVTTAERKHINAEVEARKANYQHGQRETLRKGTIDHARGVIAQGEAKGQFAAKPEHIAAAQAKLKEFAPALKTQDDWDAAEKAALRGVEHAKQGLARHVAKHIGSNGKDAEAAVGMRIGTDALRQAKAHLNAIRIARPLPTPAAKPEPGPAPANAVASTEGMSPHEWHPASEKLPPLGQIVKVKTHRDEVYGRVINRDVGYRTPQYVPSWEHVGGQGGFSIRHEDQWRPLTDAEHAEASKIDAAEKATYATGKRKLSRLLLSMATAVEQIAPPPGLPTEFAYTLGGRRKVEPVAYFKKKAISVGQYRHPVTGQWFTVTPADIEEMARKYQLMRAAGIDIPVVEDHQEKANKSQGYVVQCSHDGKSIEVVHQAIGEEAARLHLKNRVSLCIDPDYVDEFGRHWGKCFVHSALTPRPVITGQGSFVPLSRGAA